MASIITAAQSAVLAVLDGAKGAQSINDIDQRTGTSWFKIKAGTVLKTIKDLVVGLDTKVDAAIPSAKIVSYTQANNGANKIAAASASKAVAHATTGFVNGKPCWATVNAAAVQPVIAVATDANNVTITLAGNAVADAGYTIWQDQR